MEGIGLRERSEPDAEQDQQQDPLPDGRLADVRSRIPASDSGIKGGSNLPYGNALPGRLPRWSRRRPVAVSPFVAGRGPTSARAPSCVRRLACPCRRGSVVDMAAVSAREARLAGFPSADALARRLARRRWAGLPDRPRSCRAGPQDSAQKRGDALADPVGHRSQGRLRRIDAGSRRGPWTVRALNLLAGHPGVRAARLAPLLDRETLAFKRDIRC